MSYLNVPRIHFCGQFQADPSTVNNNDNNWDPNVQLSNNQNAPGWVYWNPTGTHNWKLVNCTVQGAANDQGPFTRGDPIIGAQVLSVGRYPAKVVDLDPDNQCVSQIWGLQIQIVIQGGAQPASVTATMPPTAFCDLWARAQNAPPGPLQGMPSMCAAFQAVLTNVVFENASASPLLTALKNATAKGQLSIRFNVDSFQSDSSQSNFTMGRVVGTIGPVLPNEAPRSTPRRLAPVNFPPSNNTPPTPSIASIYGPAGGVWDASRKKLILDLGNCVPTDAAAPQPPSGPSVPNVGWPINSGTPGLNPPAPYKFQVTIPGPSVTPPANQGVKAGGRVGCGVPTVLGGGPIPFSTSTYEQLAGVVEISVSDAKLIYLLQNQPLTLTDVTSGQRTQAAAQEDSQGRYVDVDCPFFRLNPANQSNPAQTAQVNLWATKFGQPWVGASLDLQPVPAIPANNGAADGPAVPWQNASPASALALQDTKGNAVTSITTGPNGVASVVLVPSNPGTPRTYSDQNPGPDGQVYWVTGSWANWGLSFLFPGTGIVNSPPSGTPDNPFALCKQSPLLPYSLPINVLIFSSYPMPLQPNWDDHVGPILSSYARLYPYMKGIIDLGDYNTVVANAPAIQRVLNLPVTDPHCMPIVRDLSRDKLAMINQWFNTNTPKLASTGVA